MAITFQPLHRHFAAEVRGFDMREPIDAVATRAFEQAIDQYGILVFPRQHVDDAQQLAFSKTDKRVQLGVQVTQGLGAGAHPEVGMSAADAVYCSASYATVKAMEQVSGPVIAIGLVLSAVFVPCAFITGITGQFFRQFALTIAVSTVISAFNSLTLSPALAAILLQPHGTI